MKGVDNWRAEKHGTLRCILAARKKAKTVWLQDLLDKAVSGDFRAAGYFRRRTNSSRTALNGCAGGFQKAVSDLRHFYKRKLSSEESLARQEIMATFWPALGLYQVRSFSERTR